jgi:hypothetical protein
MSHFVPGRIVVGKEDDTVPILVLDFLDDLSGMICTRMVENHYCVHPLKDGLKSQS